MRKAKIDATMINLVNSEGVIIEHGSIVHLTAGPFVGKAYRYEGVIISGHHTYRVKITRKSIAGHFRAVEWCHPSMIGCEVRVPLTRCQQVGAFALACWTKIDDWFMAGLVALVPLAWFEHYHMATKITEILSLGMITGGH